MKTILEAKEVTKSYGTNQENLVLKRVNIEMKAGEFVSIMGPSGSGKSSLLYNISGMDKLSSGSVKFNGQELTALSEEELSNLRLYRMGFIFQQIHLLKNLTLFDNIILSAYLAKKYSRAEINKRAKELMEKTGIAQLAQHRITEASGGQLQRAAICRALINDPDILFGDEPTGALNSRAADEVMDILTDVNAMGTAILLVTHDAKVATRTERVLYMLDGKIVGEFQLGKYRRIESERKEREEALIEWLRVQGY